MTKNDAARASRPPLSTLTTVLLLGLVAIVARMQTFGNPVIGFDEQFYLLVGDRMLHGAVPYLDIWDRKPIGLFLIYAAIRLLGGEGTLQYQGVALLFATGTSTFIYLMARRIAPPWAAVAGAAAYLLWLNFAEGEGGQTPVFYNLPMAAAALLTLCAVQPGARRPVALGTAAMLLCGIAIQIKYTAFSEGVLFGLTLLWSQWRRVGGAIRLLALATSWMTTALLPTALAWFAYWTMGAADAFVFANFVSIFGRSDPAANRLVGWAALLGILAPLLWPALADLRRGRREHDHNFVLVWLGVALVSLVPFVVLATPHLLMPVFVPVTIAAAAGLARRPRYAVGLLAFALIAGQIVLWRTHMSKGGRVEALAVAAAARPQAGCLYVYDGYPALYRLTGSCLPSRFVFPGHLNTAAEDHVAALGIDPEREEARILAARPATIVDTLPAYALGNRRTRAILEKALARDYTLVATVRTGSRRRLVYALRTH